MQSILLVLFSSPEGMSTQLNKLRTLLELEADLFLI
jgi:hypothetical protein